MRMDRLLGRNKVALVLGTLVLLSAGVLPAAAAIVTPQTAANTIPADKVPAATPVVLEVTGFDESATWFDGIELDGPDWGEHLAD